MQLAPVIVSGSSVSDSLKFRRAEARGQWEISKQILLDNKVHQGVAGYQVITPLRIEGTNRYLLVNRGWIPRATNYPTAPSVPTPPNAQLISGLLTIPSSRFLELGNEVFSENIWQNLTTERFKARTGLDVLPYVLYPPVAVPPLLSAYDKPNAGIEKHVEYMMTWYALAATIVILWLALNIHFAAPSGETNSIDRVQKRVSA
jgi:surfeit locus 1 family protein